MSIEAYRDDGPVADALRRFATLPGSSTLLTVLAAVPVAVALSSNRPADRWDVATGVVLLVVLGALAGRGTPGRLSWLVPPLLRVIEYVVFLRVTTLVDERLLPYAYALLATLTFHHYDIVYRLRHQRREPPRWLRYLGGGWDGRLLVLVALVFTGVLPTALAVLVPVLAVVYVAESVTSWLRFSVLARPALYEEADDEDD